MSDDYKAELAEDLARISAQTPDTPSTYTELRTLIARLSAPQLPDIKSARQGIAADAALAGTFGASAIDSPLVGDPIGFGSGAALGVTADQFAIQANNLLDPTFESSWSAAAITIPVGPGWTNISAQWRARYTLLAGVAPAITAQLNPRRTENLYGLHTGVLQLTPSNQVAPNFESVLIELEPILGFTPAQTLFNNIIAAVRLAQGSMLNFAGTVTVVVSVVNAAGAIVATTAAFDVLTLGSGDFKRLAISYTDTLANIQAGSWKMRVGYTVTRAAAPPAGPNRATLLIAEPQLALSPTQAIQPFTPLVGSWTPLNIPKGYLPWALPWGVEHNTTFANATNLPINGGSVMVPIFVAAPMLLQGYVIGQKDAAGIHALEARLYLDNNDDSTRGAGWGVPGGAGFVTAVPGTDATFAYTPAAADVRLSTAVSGAAVRLEPGLYWLAIRNTSAAVIAGLGSTANATFLGGAGGFFVNSQVKTLAAALPATTLDAVTGWTKAGGIIACGLNGRVFSQAAGYT